MMNSENNNYGAPVQPELSMKWHKFLICFSLWAGAVLNVLNGVMVMTGMQYDGRAEMVYAHFDGLQLVDILYGVLLLAAAVYGIVVRFQLAGYKASGVSGLTKLYGLVIGIEVFYAVFAGVMLGMDMMGEMMGTLVRSVAPMAVMLFVNRSYYKKREHMFMY